MSERTAVLGNLRQIGRRAAANVEPAQSAPKDPSSAAPPRLKRRGDEADLGIEVREEELGTVQAQQMYKMRCDCGRSWYELELRKLVQCPACHKPGLVSTSQVPRHAGVPDGRRGSV